MRDKKNKYSNSRVRLISENFRIQMQGKFICMGGVMLSELASRAVDLGSTSGQVMTRTMKVICVASPLSLHD